MKTTPDDLIGAKFVNKAGLEFTVVRRGTPASSPHHNRLYDVVFTETGTEVHGALKHQITKGKVKDHYAKTIHGVACYGATETKFDKALEVAMYQVWYRMVKRCYCPTDVRYPSYGRSGVYVVDRWLVFSNFLEDVAVLPGWGKRISVAGETWELDKDISGLGYYGPDACRWVSRTRNLAHRRSLKPHRATHQDGRVVDGVSLAALCRQVGVNRSTARNSRDRGSATSTGWTFHEI